MTLETTVVIPDGMRFADLHVGRDPETGDLEFDADKLSTVLVASGFGQLEHVDEIEDIEIANLITIVIAAWYDAALDEGQPEDPTMEAFIAQTDDDLQLPVHAVNAIPMMSTRVH